MKFLQVRYLIGIWLMLIPIVAQSTTLTTVERHFLTESKRQLNYANEKIPVIETKNLHELGQLAALHFIDWVSQNPSGVIALPTGKTPEYFIKYLNYYKSKWHEKAVQEELAKAGIVQTDFPDTSNLKFVQLDEFYPISPKHKKSFYYYVNNYYIKLLDLKPENVLSIDIAERGILKEKGIGVVFRNGKVDLSLLDRKPRNRIEKWQKQALQEAKAFCKDYENKINDLKN